MNEEHSPLGGSVAKRNMMCAGSYWLVNAPEIPDEAPSWYAAQGTLMHKLGEGMLRTYLAEKAGEKRAFAHSVGCIEGAKHKVDGFEFTVDADMLTAVEVYVDFCKSIIDKYGLDADDVKLEEKVAIPALTTNDLWGKPDFRALIPFVELHVVDFKGGAGVEVKILNNEQLMYYALAVYMSLSKVDRAEIKNVAITIVQPRGAGDKIKTQRFKVEKLLEFKGQLLASVDRIAIAEHDPYRYLNPGYEWCRFCKAKPLCPAIKQLMLDDIGISSFARVKRMNARDLKAEELAKWLKLGPELRSFLKSVDNFAVEYVKKGNSIPGRKMERVLSDRAWADEEKMIATFSPVYGKSVYKPVKQVLKSPAEMERLIKALRKRKDLEKAEEKLLDVDLWKGPLIERHETGYKLVSDDTQTSSGNTDFEGLNFKRKK